MGATIANYPDMKTVAYAELWSADPFVIVANDWWPHASLPSEDKGDERDIGGGVRYKMDVPARCWIIWEGTSDGRRVLQVQRAADGHPLDNPPGASFLPIEPGVNVISFGAEPEPPEEPEPEEPRALEEWLQIFISQPGYNDCQNYNVGVVVDPDDISTPKYEVIGIHHLTGIENNGNHNLYIDVLDESGKLNPDAVVEISNQGGLWELPTRNSDITPMWDVPLWKEDDIIVTVGHDEFVTGINSAHPDEDEGNTLYHHSFYVVFQKVAQQPEPEPEPPEVPGLPDGWTPNSIHIYFGGVEASPVVSYYIEAEFATLGIQREHYLELWEDLRQLLVDAISEFH